MFKRILVAVDGSQTGELALQMAIRLATQFQAQLRIVHVVDITNINLGAEFPEQSGVPRNIEEGKDLLQRSETAAVAAGVATESNLITIETLAQRIPETIADDAETWPAGRPDRHRHARPPRSEAPVSWQRCRGRCTRGEHACSAGSRRMSARW